MQNVLINMREKFHNDRLRNDRALGNWKSDNNINPKNKHKKINVCSAWRPVSGSKKFAICNRQPTVIDILWVLRRPPTRSVSRKINIRRDLLPEPGAIRLYCRGLHNDRQGHKQRLLALERTIAMCNKGFCLLPLTTGMEKWIFIFTTSSFTYVSNYDNIRNIIEKIKQLPSICVG